MNKIIISGIISSLLITNITAAEYKEAVSTFQKAVDTYDSVFAKGTKLATTLDENNNIHPDIFLPINFTQSLSTAIEYRTTQELQNGTVDGDYDSSNKDTTLDKEILNLYLLKYSIKNQKSTYSFGIGYSSESFNKNQKGFVTSGATTLTFDNNINIDIQGVSIFADAIYYNIIDDLSAKINILILAASKLDVTQDTELVGFSNGQGSSSEDLDLIYELRADFNYDLTSYMDLGFETRYKFLPMKYSLEMAQSDSTFTTEKYEVDEKITYNALKLYFKIDLLGSLRPMVGYSIEKTDGTNKLDSTSYSNTENMFMFGLNTKF